jgi:hypothetical protein
MPEFSQTPQKDFFAIYEDFLKEIVSLDTNIATRIFHLEGASKHDHARVREDSTYVNRRAQTGGSK